jgi:DegV family protein with EDD domain
MYQIVTDSCCDLPYTYLKAENVPFVSMTIDLDGEELVDDLGESFDYVSFLEKIKAGSMPTTSQINVGRYCEFFRPFVEQGTPVIYLAFSSGLSGSYQSAVQAVSLLREEYSAVEIYVIDTKAASLGQGLLVREAVRLKKEGHSLADVVAYIEEKKMHVHSWVTVDDLQYLERGGRISKSAAAIGGLMNIKPIIRMDELGKLQAVGKARGRKKALLKVASETVAGITEPLEQTLLIAYAGAQADAEKVKELIEKQRQVADILLYPLGPTITCHTGYGCIAVFSFGKKR